MSLLHKPKPIPSNLIERHEQAVESQKEWIRLRGLTPDGYKKFYAKGSQVADGSWFLDEPLRYIVIWAGDVELLVEAMIKLRRAQGRGGRTSCYCEAVFSIFQEAEAVNRKNKKGV